MKSEPTLSPEDRVERIEWCVKVWEDAVKRLDNTWPHDHLLIRCERAFEILIIEIERLEKIAYPIGAAVSANEERT